MTWRNHRQREPHIRRAAATLSTCLFFACSCAGAGQTTGTGSGLSNAPTKKAEAIRPEHGPSSVRGPDWGKLRSAAPALLGWKVGLPLISLQRLTFFDALEQADRLGVTSIEGFSNQKVSVGIPKNLDYRLAPGEIKGIKERLRDLNLEMPAYFVSSLGSDEATIRKVFEFARSLEISTIITDPDPSVVPALDRLANEFGVNVALYSRGGQGPAAYSNPKVLMETLQDRSGRLGACADLGSWTKEGISPIDGLKLLKDRLLVVNLGDGGRADLSSFLMEMYRLALKPTFVGVGSMSSDETIPELSKSLEGFERAVGPVAVERVAELSRTTPIKGPERLTPEERRDVEAALPAEAPAKPRKPRKLLVIDLNVAYGGVNGGHRSIPAANLAIGQMGKRTGAYEAIFSNDVANLKYDKIRQFDAVFLNNTVGTLFVDPEVREGLRRFVLEGGGLAGYHGTTHASMDWDEFGEMLGARQGTHREPTEIGIVKIDDPNSPLTVPFHGQEFAQQDEFYRFAGGPYSRDKVHVLLSLDVEKTDMNQGANCVRPCVREDHDYAVSWIRSYGKGRVFYCTLGHWPKMFAQAPLDQFFLGAIQFVLGDLPADTTPSARLRP
jgi:type 1 glutamine amidotransferase/sugar phosphate isomerase/epimerase